MYLEMDEEGQLSVAKIEQHLREAYKERERERVQHFCKTGNGQMDRTG